MIAAEVGAFRSGATALICKPIAFAVAAAMAYATSRTTFLRYLSRLEFANGSSEAILLLEQVGSISRVSTNEILTLS